MRWWEICEALCWGLDDKGGDNTWQIESDTRRGGFTAWQAVFWQGCDRKLGVNPYFPHCSHNPPPWPPSHPERENTGLTSTLPLLTKGHRVKVEPRMSFVFSVA